jgi:hypothetical protein
LTAEHVIEWLNLGLYEVPDPVEFFLKIRIRLKAPQGSVLQ